MDIQANIRNVISTINYLLFLYSLFLFQFKDFLQLYNQMTETCFRKCVDNINSRKLDPIEMECIDDCSSKFIRFNQRLMGTFMEVQSIIVNQRIKDVEEQQAKLLMESSLDPKKTANVHGISEKT